MHSPTGTTPIPSASSALEQIDGCQPFLEPSVPALPFPTLSGTKPLWRDALIPKASQQCWEGWRQVLGTREVWSHHG